VTGDTCTVTQQGVTTTWVSSAISANCAVTATFAIDTFTVTAVSGGNGTITPPSQSVNSGSAASFTVTPNAAYHVASVTGDTCTVTQQGVTTTWISSAISANCAVTATFAPNPATQLVFVQQPTDGTAGVALSPAVTLEARDAFGDVVTTDTNNVTVTVSGPGPFDPGSTQTAALSGGVATFNNLAFDVAGSGYTLTAHDAGDGLTSSPSNPFSIVAAAAAKIVFTAQPANVTSGSTLGSVAVTEEDLFGNVITTDSASSVDFTVAACGGPVDLGNVTLSNGVGILAASSQRFYTLATGLTVTATSGSFTANSNTFDVVANPGLMFSDGFESCRL
jgi:hypothetical protein